MKTLIISLLAAKSLTVETIPAVMDDAGIPFQPVDQINWPQYPYLPRAEFRIAYTPEAFVLHYRVTEQAVRAAAQGDDDPVWEDSCMEFFFAPFGDGFYYNIECNCAGTLLLGMGPAGPGRKRATPEVLAGIGRFASLGREPFGVRKGEQTWEVCLLVPYSVFTLRPFRPEKGMKIRGNFYKCGDSLPVPHFVTWNPVDAPKPDFHRPDSFGELVFG